MIPPITREEKYIYEIVGAGKTAPEKPLTRREIFYAVILGEDRTIPRPITNEEKYLAALAGAYSEALPFPTTRIEKFLAKAAGMDVETPVPVTREELFWDNYSAVQKFEGVPPLTFKSNGKALKNYRIYGSTVEGESVGDRTRNLFDGQLIDGYYADNTLSSITGTFGIYQSCKISLPAGTYTIVFTEAVRIIRYIELEGTYLTNPEGNKDVASYTFTLHGNNTVSLAFRNASNTMWDGTIKIQIVEGSESLPYEPYGYRVPVAINDYTVTLYLTEPLKMVEDEAEYVDYAQQKQHRVRKNLCQINKVNNAVISHAIEGQIYTFSLTADFSVGFRLLKRNADSGSTEAVASAFNREGRVSATFTANENFDVYVNGFSAVGDKTFLDSVHDFMFEKGATASEYEPYIENTELDVTIPELPTIAGTNTLSVDTQVQPSKVYVEVGIKTV